MMFDSLIPRSWARIVAAVRVDHGAFDHILQFPDIAFPGGFHQDIHGLVGDRRAGLSGLPRNTCSENAWASGRISSRRSRSGGMVIGKNIQSVEQVFPEQLRSDGFFDVLVRCRDHPHIDLDRLAAADALDHLFLQHAQQFCLERQVHVADLVEENRALVRQFEFAELSVRRLR